MKTDIKWAETHQDALVQSMLEIVTTKMSEASIKSRVS